MFFYKSNQQTQHPLRHEGKQGNVWHGHWNEFCSNVWVSEAIKIQEIPSTKSKLNNRLAKSNKSKSQPKKWKLCRLLLPHLGHSLSMGRWFSFHFCQGTGQLLGRARIDYLFRDVFAKSLNAKVWRWGGGEATILKRLREIPQEFADCLSNFATKWISMNFNYQWTMTHCKIAVWKPHKVQRVWVSAVGISANSALYLPFPKCRLLSPKLPTLNFLHQLRGIKVVILD